MKDVLVLTGDHSLPDVSKPEGRYGNEDIETHERMAVAMASIPGLSVEVWNSHDRLFERLAERCPDLVVNFCDTGYRNVAADELAIPVFCETLGLAYTGAPPSAMVICYDKQIVRLVAETIGAPTPREVMVARAEESLLPDYLPALLKPNRADGSLGITKDAVVRTRDEARAYLAFLRESLNAPDVLYQEYLPGPEYGIGVIGNSSGGLRALPPLSVDFSRLPKESAPILSYESKSIPDSPYWTDIQFRQAEIDSAMQQRMEAVSFNLFHRLGLRDYGRFDFRCDASGTPKLLEVNPNPAWSWDGKLALMAGFEGLSYSGMLQAIIEAALRRTSA